METSDNSQGPNLSPSISSAEVTPASRSLRPGSAEEKQTPAIFGPRCSVSFAYFDPDMFLWKTSQATFLSGLEQFSETWPDAGTMRNGVVYELRTSEPPTCESASSSWHTVSTEDHKSDGPRALSRYGTPAMKTSDQRLLNQAMTWPTARQEDGESCGNHPGVVDSLTGAAKTWLTPHGMANEDRTGKKGGAGGGEFALQANNWQTPATDSFRSRGGDRKDEQGLDQQARMFPPSPPAPQIPDGPPSFETAPTSRRRLNPRFVEWLQGFPVGWTEL